MKKGLVLIVALLFALSVTAVFAADQIDKTKPAVDKGVADQMKAPNTKADQMKATDTKADQTKAAADKKAAKKKAAADKKAAKKKAAADKKADDTK